jgi:hypothetical protein
MMISGKFKKTLGDVKKNGWVMAPKMLLHAD